MTSRLEVRIGRNVAYQALDAEATAVGDALGTVWPATVVRINNDANRSVNLIVFRGDGTTLAKTVVLEGPGKGAFSTTGLGPSKP